MKEKLINDLNESNKNIIITGDLGTGKTSGILFPIVDKIVNANKSFIVIDPREEYLKKYYNGVKSKGYNTIVLNLNDMSKSDGWNPFELPYQMFKKGDKDRSLNYLDQIGSEIFYENSTADPFWSQSSADFFTGVTLALFEDAKEDEINLSSVNVMFDGLNKKFVTDTYLGEYFRFKNPSDQSYIYVSNTIFAPKDTRSSILSVAKQKLRLYVSRESVNKLLSKTTFDFKEINNKPTAIFIITKESNTSINSLASIFVKQLFSYLSDNRCANKFNFILDNLDTIENISEIVQMMSAGVSRNIKFVLVTRSKEILESQYGSYMFKLSNTIDITEKQIESIVANEKQTIENSHEEVKIPNEKIVYPSLKSTIIKTFPLEEYVQSKRKYDIFSETSNEDNPLNYVDKVSIDDMITSIDEKMAQLEKK